MPRSVNELGELSRLSEVDLHELVEVNDSINRSTRYCTDTSAYGRTDFWNVIADGSGDCEDYAVTKRRELLKRGWPKSSLRLTLCWDFLGRYHAVLAVCAADRTLILDNLSRQIRTAQECGYRWHMQEIPGQRKFQLFGGGSSRGTGGGGRPSPLNSPPWVNQ